MEKESRKNERRSGTRVAVPHPAFDWYVNRIGVAAFLISGVFGLLAWWHQRRLFYAMGFDSAVGQSDLITEYARLTLIANALAVVTCFLLVMFVAMHLVHKIVGPVYRLKQHMLAIARGGEPSEIRFRKNDQFADVGEAFNELLRSLDLLDPKPLVGSADPEPPAPPA